MKKISFKLIVGAIAIVASLVALPSSQASAASGCTAYTYRQGSSGNCVRYIQTILTYNTWGGPCGNVSTAVVIDGSFGPKTAAGVKGFQGEDCLVADGIVGPKTWYSLCERAFFTHVASPTDSDKAWGAGLSAGCWSIFSNYCYSGRWCVYV